MGAITRHGSPFVVLSFYAIFSLNWSCVGAITAFNLMTSIGSSKGVGASAGLSMSCMIAISFPSRIDAGVEPNGSCMYRANPVMNYTICVSRTLISSVIGIFELMSVVYCSGVADVMNWNIFDVSSLWISGVFSAKISFPYSPVGAGNALSSSR